MSKDGLKSAYEIAMEKLRARDREQGVTQEAALSDDQKRRIGEIRTNTTAKLAEMEILWRSERARLQDDPEVSEKAGNEYKAERARVEERAEAKIASIRRESR